VRSGIALTTGQPLELNFRLELVAVAETVTVSGDAALIETRASNVTQPIESKSIEDLPLGSRRTRNVIHLTRVAVFVRYNNTPGNANHDFSLAGGRTQSQTMWIDGGAA
jgi:hypothetical protein